ncbi:TCP-1/cpn60 chaperonin family protein [Paenibacillus oceani]|uniref:TCP-1/cpn60 chaperonin family protein n=1 Tax=Paenibacillus oceani TaxID=2772510 RepID=A0A927CBW5_9BACL|nr:TCP-1/cpn60 chaperonin family protein [Paenibacillus oceani]MBD2863892.1 TCP-1/cpn60 chaperonin family protein [Paenibacillus oceani]
MKQPNHEGEERHAALLNNAAAIRAICSAVEGTLGPKGLDTMLVGPSGDVLVTNDGATILEKMDVTHPAARMLVQVARSQQEQIGDGTTTATVLAGALVSEGVAQVTRGVPVAKVVQGIQEGVRFAAERMHARSRAVNGPDDPILCQIAYVAGREQSDIAELVVEAARKLGGGRLSEDGFRFADLVSSHERRHNEVWPGLLLEQKPYQAHHFETECAGCSVLVLYDALEPDKLEEEALVTESGFQTFMKLKERFAEHLRKLLALNIRLVATDRSADPEAEQFCSDHGIMLLQRTPKRELERLCEFTGAKPARRSALGKPEDELFSYIGRCAALSYDGRIRRVRVSGGAGKPTATVLVGASTREVVGERARIAKDAAAAVQAAIRGGYLPGGGSVELAVAHELERYRETATGLEAFGLEAAAHALRKPLAQIALNAGFNPLEKVEAVKAAQLAEQSDCHGIDCDTGSVTDCLAAGVVDPAPVKMHALRAAGEVAAAVLRIHTVIKMRSDE